MPEATKLTLAEAAQIALLVSEARIEARLRALAEAEHAIRREREIDDSMPRRAALAHAARIVADLREGRAT